MRDLDKYMLDIDTWHTPASDYAEGVVGDYRLHHGRYTRGMYRMWGVDGYLFFKVTKPITITSLQERRGKRWHDWMVDDLPNFRAMQIYAEQAKGNVLTTGLGLIIPELAKNPKVKRVFVVEKSPEVVALVSPYVPKDAEIIIGDFYDFIEVDKRHWDTIIVDLWVSSGKEEKLELFHHEVLPMVVVLKDKYPNASITFHGFQAVSDIKPVSDEMVELIKETGGI